MNKQISMMDPAAGAVNIQWCLTPISLVLLLEKRVFIHMHFSIDCFKSGTTGIPRHSVPVLYHSIDKGNLVPAKGVQGGVAAPFSWPGCAGVRGSMR